MSLRDLMFEDLARGFAIVRDGHEIVPTWRIITPEGDFVILTRFDPDKPEQRARMLTLVPLFMAWKMAMAFVLTTETWLGPERTRSGEEAVLAIGVSRTERLGVLRRIHRTPGLVFMPPEWLRADSIDENYFRLLPSGHSTVTDEEAAMLASVFGENGELPAKRLNWTAEKAVEADRQERYARVSTWQRICQMCRRWTAPRR
jgi:hypothetical protein